MARKQSARSAEWYADDVPETTTENKSETTKEEETTPGAEPIIKPAEKGTRNKLTAAIEAYLNRTYINGLVAIKTKPEQMGRYYGAVDILRIMGYTVERKANRHTVRK